MDLLVLLILLSQSPPAIIREQSREVMTVSAAGLGLLLLILLSQSPPAIIRAMSRDTALSAAWLGSLILLSQSPPATIREQSWEVLAKLAAGLGMFLLLLSQSPPATLSTKWGMMQITE